MGQCSISHKRERKHSLSGKSVKYAMSDTSNASLVPVNKYLKQQDKKLESLGKELDELKRAWALWSVKARN